MENRTTLGELAALVRGTVVGDPSTPIRGTATLRHASADEISFVDHPKLRDKLVQSAAAAVLVPRDWTEVPKPTIQVDQVRTAFAQIVAFFRPPHESVRSGVSPQASVDATAEIGDNVEIHPFAVIGPGVKIGRGSTIHAHATVMGRCQVGEQVTIYPGAVLYRDTQVGDRCVVHAGAVLGAYGFGYDTIQGRHQRGDQLGYVVLESDVEIGANATVDRGTYGPTVIGQGTKIDNLVMVAHNCRLGRHNLICSQVGIAGSSTTGDYVVMAGQVGVPDHVTIGDRAILGAKSGIMRDVPAGITVLGIPATPERDQMAKQAAFAKLPEMRKQLRNLQRQVDRISQWMESANASTPAESDAECSATQQQTEAA
jgi:UDP-3-O-[3-hydroxymyristoyl] glucosamine N-acyltransferase